MASWWLGVLLVSVAVAETQSLGSHEAQAPKGPLTATPSGFIQGSWMETRRGRRVEGYRGVRYAHAPVGELRFQPPVLIESYPGVVDATQDGPACPQPAKREYPIDEDCLRLNVYTPGKGKKPLPVIVYLHAGGFYSGSGRSDVAGPEYLLDRDLVLVTVNYRLGSLGFMSTGDAFSPGNYGLKDQVAALRWVRGNIAAFGGDPARVTLAGYSAGSFSVMLHMVSPMSRGLFHRAMSLSGSPISQIPILPAQSALAARQAELLNCTAASNEAMVACLRTKTGEEFGKSLPGFFGFSHDPIIVWMPVVEPDCGQPRFLDKHLLASIARGEVAAVPYVISYTSDEFFWKALNVLKNATLLEKLNAEWDSIAPISFQLPSATAANALRQVYLGDGPLRNDSQTADGLGKLYSDAVIKFGVNRLVELMSLRASPRVCEFAYRGRHSHREDDSGRPLGVAHHDDLIYLFGISALFPLIAPDASADSAVVDVMTGMWHNFALNGDPNPIANVTWPVYTSQNQQYLRLGNTVTVRETKSPGCLLHEEQECRVWEDLFPLQVD